MRKNLHNRLFFSIIVLLLVFSMLISGCARRQEADTGEIVFWSWSESETLGLAQRFNRVYPDITVRFVPTDSAGFLMRFQTALMAGSELPNVALQESVMRGGLFALDCWENLENSPYNFDRNIVFPQILPVMVNERNEVVGIERELNPSGLLYKRPLALQFFGTDDPYELGALIPDWESFIEHGARIAQATGGRVKMLPSLFELAQVLLFQHSELIFHGNNVNATDFFTKNLDIMIRMNRANAVGRLPAYSPAWNASFLDDDHLFYLCAPWTSQWILKPNDPDSVGRWGVTTAPVRGFSFGGTAYGIPTNARNKESAWKFIEWATTTDDGIQAAIDVVGAIVSRRATYAAGFPFTPDPFFAGQDPNAFLMERAAPTMQIRPISQHDIVLADVLSFISDALENNVNISLQDAVQMAMAEIRNSLPANLTIH